METPRGNRAVLATVRLVGAVTACALLLPAQAFAESTAVPQSFGVGRSITGTVNDAQVPVAFAGLIGMNADGVATWAYCVDVLTPLAMLVPYEEISWSESGVANLAHVARILQVHPADATVARGDSDEAAAVQAAIWHFTDGFVLTGASAEVRQLYESIVFDALTNPISSEPSTSLSLTPSGGAGAFTLATNSTGPVELRIAPVGAAEVVDCATGTPLGSSTQGPYPRDVCLRPGAGASSVTLSASATATLSAGRVFFRPGSQRIITASGRGLGVSVNATWAVPAPPAAPAPPVAPSPPSVPQPGDTPSAAPTPGAPAPGAPAPGAPAPGAPAPGAPAPAPAPVPRSAKTTPKPKPKQGVLGARRTKAKPAAKARPAAKAPRVAKAPAVAPKAKRAARPAQKPRRQIPFTP